MQVDIKSLSPQLKRLLLLPRYDQRTPEWYKQRAQLDITASDAGSLLKGTPWRAGSSRDMLFKEKTGQVQRKGGGAAQAHGTYYEDEALEKYCEKTGQQVLTFGCIPHPVYTWMGASPDAVTLTNRLVEIKVKTESICVIKVLLRSRLSR